MRTPRTPCRGFKRPASFLTVRCHCRRRIAEVFWVGDTPVLFHPEWSADYAVEKMTQQLYEYDYQGHVEGLSADVFFDIDQYFRKPQAVEPEALAVCRCNARLRGWLFTAHLRPVRVGDLEEGATEVLLPAEPWGPDPLSNNRDIERQILELVSPTFSRTQEEVWKL